MWNNAFITGDAAGVPAESGTRPPVAQVVGAVIDLALKERRWSFSMLARELGLAENTLKRWRQGECRSFDLAAVVKLFKLANTSLDATFDVVDNRPVQAPVHSDNSLLEKKLQRVENLLDELAPLKLLANALKSAQRGDAPSSSNEGGAAIWMDYYDGARERMDAKQRALQLAERLYQASEAYQSQERQA